MPFLWRELMLSVAPLKNTLILESVLGKTKIVNIDEEQYTIVYSNMHVKFLTNKYQTSLKWSWDRQQYWQKLKYIRVTIIVLVYRNLEPKRLRTKLLKYQNKFCLMQDEAEEMYLGNELESWEVC